MAQARTTRGFLELGLLEKYCSWHLCEKPSEMVQENRLREWKEMVKLSENLDLAMPEANTGLFHYVNNNNKKILFGSNPISICCNQMSVDKSSLWPWFQFQGVPATSLPFSPIFPML